MAERMKTLMPLALPGFFLVLALGWRAAAGAELRDPTRPPLAPVPVVKGSQRTATGPSGILTAIRIDAGQRVATIGGVCVRVGDSVEGGTVRVIRGTEVVLSTPAGPRVMKLFPGVHQQASTVRARSATPVAQRDRAPVAVEGAPAPAAPPMPALGDSPQ